MYPVATDITHDPCSSDDEAIINNIESWDAVIKGYSSCELSETSDEELPSFAAANPHAPDTLWHDLRTAAISSSMTTTQIDAVLAALHKHGNCIGKMESDQNLTNPCAEPLTLIFPKT